MIMSLIIVNRLINTHNSLLKVLVDGSLGAIIYLVICKVLKIEEFDEGVEIIFNRFCRRKI